MSIPHSLLSQLVKLALDEDLNYQTAEQGDITAQLIPAAQHANAKVITREDCVFCGKDIILEVFKQVDPSVAVNVLVNDGDTVIVKKTDTADNGKIVVALIDDHEAMLKRIRRKGKTVALESANRNYETKIFGPDRVKVQGVLVSLYRNFS